MPGKYKLRGSGCSTADSAVASDTRGPGFESDHQPTFIEHNYCLLFVEKTKINKKRP